ncbi:MAG: hypothetical protein O7H41_16055 [Planctomycetota bacterium]|nr:hypothetical protein [Planctomycetota bacterium]
MNPRVLFIALLLIGSALLLVSPESGAGDKVKSQGPPGIKLVKVGFETFLFQRMQLVDRFYLFVKFKNQSGAPITFEEGTVFLLDDEEQVIGTTPIDKEMFSENHTLDSETSLFIDGRVVTNISGSIGEWINGMVIDDADRIVVAGAGIDKNSSAMQFALARYHPDGALDDTFGKKGIVFEDLEGTEEEVATSLAMDAEGRIVVAGFAETQVGRIFAIARLLPDGEFDEKFDEDGWVLTPIGLEAQANAVAVDGSGRIIAAGRADFGGGHQFAVAAYGDDGVPDAAFGAGGIVITDFVLSSSEEAFGIAIGDSDRIVLAGRASPPGGQQFALARYLPNGDPDNSFNFNGRLLTDIVASTTEQASAVTISPAGGTLAAGTARVEGEVQYAIVRYDEFGQLDPNWGGSGIVVADLPTIGERARAIGLDPIGRVLTAGEGFQLESSLFAVARFQGIGIPDNSFHSDGVALNGFAGASFATANAVTSYFDGTILSAGWASFDDGRRFALMRHFPDGTLFSFIEPPGLTIPTGISAVFKFPIGDWPRKARPSRFNVRLKFEEFASPFIVEGIEAEVFEHNAGPYRFPLRNPASGKWKITQGHHLGSKHQGSSTQRYAYDISATDPVTGDALKPVCDVPALIQKYANDPNYDYDIDPNGSYVESDFSECKKAYGEPVYAAADGFLVKAIDGSDDYPNGYPDNFPVGEKLPEVFFNAGEPGKISGGGNSVRIDHGNGEYTSYFHLIPGSVREALGDEAISLTKTKGGISLGPQKKIFIHQGQKLGEVGNTGSSTGPHLHFDMIDKPERKNSAAVPVYFIDLEFESGPGEPLFRHLRSGISQGQFLDIEPEPLPLFELPAPEYGPGNVVEVGDHNTLEGAQRLKLPVTVSGTILPGEAAFFADGGDGLEDLYRITVAGKKTIVAELSFPPDLDLDMILYNGGLHVVKPAAAITTQNPERIVAPVGPGNYYVCVSRWDDNSGMTSGSVAPYILEIECFGDKLLGTIEDLPARVFKSGAPSPGHRVAMLRRIEHVQGLVFSDKFGRAVRHLQNLRRRTDGCGSAPDTDDWIIDCGPQGEVQALIDDLIDVLGTSPLRTGGSRASRGR